MAKATLSDTTGNRMSEVASYMKYVSEHPNYTSDEAKYWIAWIILQTKNERNIEKRKTCCEVLSHDIKTPGER